MTDTDSERRPPMLALGGPAHGTQLTPDGRGSVLVPADDRAVGRDTLYQTRALSVNAYDPLVFLLIPDRMGDQEACGLLRRWQRDQARADAEGQL